MKLATLVLMIGCATGAMAVTPLTATELREDCRVATKTHSTMAEALDGGFCLGYMMGFLHSNGSAYDYVDGQLFKYTITDNEITCGRIAEMLVKYLDEHPEDLDNSPLHTLRYMLVMDHKAELKPVSIPTPSVN